MTPADRPTPEITFGDVVRTAWKKLKEMRTVFQLLGIIAIAVLVCTVVPQGEDPQSYYERYGRFVANVIVRLGLDHVHTATWFQVLIGILLLSLVACSGRLWKEASQRWRLPTAAAAAGRTRGGGRLNCLSSLGSPQTVAAAAPALRKHGYHLLDLGAVGERHLFYAHKHRLSAWGQALAHYSVFLVALGSILGSIHGLSLDQNINIMEGDTFRSEDASIPFGIKLDRFSIVQDPANGSVKNYYSEVRIIDGDKEVLSGKISVNHPLRYKGYFLSQSDWGLGEAQIEITSGGKTTQHSFPLERAACPETSPDACMWGVPQEQAVLFLPDGSSALVAASFYADAVRKDGKVSQASTEYPGTPALSLTYVSGIPGHKPKGAAEGAPKHGMQELGFLLPGETKALADGTVKFIGITKSTGLGVRKDFGLPLVWIGFITSMVGLTMIFYFPLQRSIVAFEPRGQGRTLLTMAPYGRAGDLADDSSDVWQDMLKQVGGKVVAGSGANAEQEESTSD